MRINETFESIQGEGRYIGTRVFFIRTQECNLACDFCFGSKTKILREGCEWSPITKIKIGDRIICLEKRKGSVSWFFTVGTVKNVMNRTAETIKLNDTIITPTHKVYSHTSPRHPWWQMAKSLGGKHAVKLPIVNNSSRDYKLGWIAGCLDGDGYFHLFRKRWLRCGIFCKDNEMLQTLKDYVKDIFNYDAKITNQYHGEGNGRRKMNGIEMTDSKKVKRIHKIIQFRKVPQNKSNDYIRGYLGGFYDAEGTISTPSEIRISQKDKEMLNKVGMYCSKLNLRWTIRADRKENNSIIHTLRILDPATFFCLTIPKIKRKVKLTRCPRVIPHVKLLTAPHKKVKVYNLTVNKGNYIADGYIVKNCDTKYTWSKNGGTNVEIEEIVEKAMPYEHIVISGGESLLQLEELLELLKKLSSKQIEIETNGTIFDNRLLMNHVHFNVSPKLDFIDEDYLNTLCKWNNHCDFKFVVRDNEDLKNINNLVNKHHLKNIILMPEGIDGNVIIERTKWLIEEVQKLPVSYRVVPRLHTILWGNERRR